MSYQKIEHIKIRCPLHDKILVYILKLINIYSTTVLQMYPMYANLTEIFNFISINKNNRNLLYLEGRNIKNLI